MAAKQKFFFLLFLTLSLVSSSNAIATKSFGKLTRREAVVSEISVAPAPSTAVDDTPAELSPALSPSEYGGYGLYSSSEDDDDVSQHETRYDDVSPRYEIRYDDVSDQTPRYETRYDDVSDQSPRYESRYDDDESEQTDTRFLDNGRYYYGNSNDLGGTQRYEFDSMEEYQKYQEAHPYLP